MNTHQLQCAIDCHVDMNKTIIGVYPANDIPKKQYLPPYGFIINTDPRQLPGKHWIAMYINERGVLEAFDSYGNLPSLYSPYIKRFMDTFKRRLINTKRIQGSETRVCGQYCLFYLLCRCKGYSMKEITDIFNEDFQINDQFVYNFIDERFHCCMYPMSGLCQTCVNKI